MNLSQLEKSLHELNAINVSRSLFIQNILDAAAYTAVTQFGAVLGGDYILHLYNLETGNVRTLDIYVPGNDAFMSDAVRTIYTNLKESFYAGTIAIERLENGMTTITITRPDTPKHFVVNIRELKNIDTNSVSVFVRSDSMTVTITSLYQTLADQIATLLLNGAGVADRLYNIYLLVYRNIFDLDKVVKCMPMDLGYMIYNLQVTKNLMDSKLARMTSAVDKKLLTSAMHRVYEFFDELTLTWAGSLSKLLEEVLICPGVVTGPLAFKLQDFHSSEDLSAQVLCAEEDLQYSGKYIQSRKFISDIPELLCTPAFEGSKILLPSTETLILCEFYEQHLTDEQMRDILQQYLKRTDSIFALTDCASHYDIPIQDVIEKLVQFVQ